MKIRDGLLAAAAVARFKTKRLEEIMQDGEGDDLQAEDDLRAIEEIQRLVAEALKLADKVEN